MSDKRDWSKAGDSLRRVTGQGGDLTPEEQRDRAKEQVDVFALTGAINEALLKRPEKRPWAIEELNKILRTIEEAFSRQ